MLESETTSLGTNCLSMKSRQKFKPYAVMVDTAYENLTSEFVDNKDAHKQIENDETGQSI